MEESIENFLGVNIDIKKDGTIHLTRPLLADLILKDLNLLVSKVKLKDTPVCSFRILHRNSKSGDFSESFNYISVVCKMNYLEKENHSDISYTVNQCERFASFPK